MSLSEMWEKTVEGASFKGEDLEIGFGHDEFKVYILDIWGQMLSRKFIT